MRLALDVNSSEFIGNARVVRIMRRFWTVPLIRPPEDSSTLLFPLPRFSFWKRDEKVQDDDKEDNPFYQTYQPITQWSSNSQPFDRKDYISPFESYIGLLQLFVLYPIEFFQLPRASFLMDQVFFFAFVIVFLAWVHSSATTGECQDRLPKPYSLLSCKILWHRRSRLWQDDQG